MLPANFHPAVAAWFRSAFPAPTSVQLKAWEAIGAGTNTLISAPTGSGKTLAAFLAMIDELAKQAARGELRDETQVLYVSPLKGSRTTSRRICARRSTASTASSPRSCWAATSRSARPFAPIWSSEV